MDGSRVTQSLDFLWFYTNILTCTHDQVASLTDEFPPLIHAKDPLKRDSQKPNASSLLRRQNEPENVETTIPRCAKCGEISSATTVFEAERVISNNSEMLKSGRETEKKETRKRRKGTRSRQNGMKVILGGLDVKEVNGFMKFQESCGYQMFAIQRNTVSMPPFDDDVAMKEHLRSWAYAVACTVK